MSGRGPGFWTMDGSGMPVANINKMIQVQSAVGNLQASSAPACGQIVDQSVYADAVRQVAG